MHSFIYIDSGDYDSVPCAWIASTLGPPSPLFLTSVLALCNAHGANGTYVISLLFVVVVVVLLCLFSHMSECWLSQVLCPVLVHPPLQLSTSCHTKV